mmetsp:Transcript_40800/g.29424  ORF Transcript_40800/g.29424 Transcript_40800/m.29424 type:complete len:117 (+) Transcript_40800:637-987(+)
MLIGGVVAVRMRKVIVSSIYDKIGSLSIKSLAETNSGKLISLVSSDLFQIERPFSIIFMLIPIPLLNLTVSAIIGFTMGWIYALTTIILSVLMILLQYLTAKKLKTFQIKQGMIND